MSVLNLLKLKYTTEQLTRARYELAWVIIGQASVFVGAIVSVKVLTSAMGPKSYGQLALGITIAGFVNMFVYGPIAQIVLRFFSICQERGELSHYSAALRKIHKASGVIVLVLSILIALAINRLVNLEWALLVMMASLFGIVTGVNASLTYLQNALRKRKIVALHQGADAWLRPIIAFALVLIFSNSGYNALLGFTLGTFATTLSLGLFTFKRDDTGLFLRDKRGQHEISKRLFSEFYSYAMPFFIFAIFGAISTYSDRWVLEALFGDKEVGIYAAIIQIANAPIVLLMGVITQLMIPIIFEQAGAMTNAGQASNSEKMLRQTISMTIFLLLPIVLIAYLYGKSIITIMTSPAFGGYHQSLWVVVLGLSFFHVAQLQVTKGLNYHQTKLYIWPKCIQAVTFLVLLYLFARSMSVFGAALALCVSSFIYLISVMFVNKNLHIT